MDFSPNSVSTPSTPPASGPAADDVKRMERTLRPGQSPTEKPSPNAVRVNDDEDDRSTARIENVSLSMDEQKGRMRNRFQLPSANSADTDNSKKIIITIGLVLLFLLIALFVMAKALLH